MFNIDLCLFSLGSFRHPGGIDILQTSGVKKRRICRAALLRLRLLLFIQNQIFLLLLVIKQFKQELPNWIRPQTRSMHLCKQDRCNAWELKIKKKGRKRKDHPEIHWRMQAGWQAWRRPPGQPGSITCNSPVIHSSTWLPILTCSCSENSSRQIGQEESGAAFLNSLLWGGEIWQRKMSENWKCQQIGRCQKRPGWRLLALAARSSAGQILSRSS